MRLIVLLLSMSTVVLYGYALAGLGGYFWGHGRMDYILWGLGLGTFLGAVSLYLVWKFHSAFFKEDGQEKTKDTE